MAHVRVYQFDYFDGQLKRYRRSVDFATSDAIAEQHGTVLAESERMVDEDLLDDRGFIKARDLPLPDEVSEQEPSLARRQDMREPRQPLGR